ncbi:MAG: insulinase family protein [Myxococcales bacterium]|nr:insulinase family protein [Myxococcales bacterium]
MLRATPVRARCWRRAATTLALALIGCASARELPRPSRALEVTAGGELWRFPSGARLYFVPDSSAPLVQVDARYPVGSADDPPGAAGMAHLVEHLLGVITPAGDERALKRRFAARSLYHNAHTSRDETHFLTTALAGEFAELLALEVTRLTAGCDALSEEAFLREREVVRNELRQRGDDPGAELHARLDAAIYPKGHPYHAAIGGDDVQLASVTREDACAFIRRHYTPARALFVVAGDVDPALVQEEAARRLAKLTGEPGPARAEVTAPALGGRTVELALASGHPSASLVFPLPPRFTDDALAVDLFTDLIEDLLDELALDEPVIRDVDVYVAGGKRAPMFVMQIEVEAPAQLAAARALLWRAVDGAFASLAGEATARSERLMMRKRVDVLRRVEPLALRGGALADYLEAPPGYGGYPGELAALEALARVDVYDVARRRFARAQAATVLATPTQRGGPPRAALGYRPPPHDDAVLEEGLSLADVAGALELRRGHNMADRTRELRLANGMRVLLMPSAALPLVELGLLFNVGDVDAPPELPALASVVARTILPDVAGQRSLEDFYRAGGRLDVRVDAETTEFRVHGLAAHQDHLIAGLAVFTARGVFEDAQVAAILRRIEREVTEPRTAAALAARHALNRAVFGASHPYGLRHDPTPAQLAEVDLATLRAFKRAHYRAANATLVMAGRFDPAIAEAHIRAHFERPSLETRLERWHDEAPALPRRRAALDRGEAAHVARVDGGATQTTLRIVARPHRAVDERHAARLVAVALLNSAVGRVRSYLGASYGVYAGLAGDVGPSAITIGGEVDSARAGEALVELQRVLAELPRADALELGFSVARRAVLRDLLAGASDSSQVADQLGVIARHGLPLDYHDRLAREVARLRVDDVRALLRDELDPRELRILLQGPRAAVAAAYRVAAIKDVAWVL